MHKMYSQSVVLQNGHEIIPDIYEFEKIGAGHDGEIYRYGDRALKLLKYDIDVRKIKKLMTFDKAIYFRDQLSLKRITKPIDIMLDQDGKYVGYVMDYHEKISDDEAKKFALSSLILSIEDLEKDFNELTVNRVAVKDINRGSYIISSDFLHLCDMDKYYRSISNNIDVQNNAMFRYVIAKFLYLEMIRQKSIDKANMKKLNLWVKKCTNDRKCFDLLYKELISNPQESIGDYTQEKLKVLTFK